MGFLIGLVVIFFIVMLVEMFIISNLVRKNDTLTNMVEEYESKISDIHEKVLDIEVQLSDIDVKGAFEADDEVGFTFKAIREINSELAEYIRKISEDSYTTDNE